VCVFGCVCVCVWMSVSVASFLHHSPLYAPTHTHTNPPTPTTTPLPLYPYHPLLPDLRKKCAKKGLFIMSWVAKKELDGQVGAVCWVPSSTPSLLYSTPLSLLTPSLPLSSPLPHLTSLLHTRIKPR
jgi:hypothetical protein